MGMNKHKWEIITACYDRKNQKIYGYKKGSIIYLHEKGHDYYEKKGWNSKIDSYSSFMLTILITVLVINTQNIFIMWLLLITLGFEMGTEILAWYYVIKMRCKK